MWFSFAEGKEIVNKYYYQAISYTQCLKREQPDENMQTEACKYVPDANIRATNLPTVIVNAGCEVHYFIIHSSVNDCSPVDTPQDEYCTLTLPQGSTKYTLRLASEAKQTAYA